MIWLLHCWRIWSQAEATRISLTKRDWADEPVFGVLGHYHPAPLLPLLKVCSIVNLDHKTNGRHERFSRTEPYALSAIRYDFGFYQTVLWQLREYCGTK